MNYLNKNSWGSFINFYDNAALFNCEAVEKPCGARVIDAGVNVRGGFSAGLRVIELSTACLSTATINLLELDGEPWPHVEIQTDQPYWGCFVCQSGNRALSIDEPKTIPSGPACILADHDHIGGELGITDDSDCAVMILEVGVLPDDSACKALAERCGVIPSRLGIVIVPTASLAGIVQITGRTVEVAMHKLDNLGVDIRKISSGIGRCPILSPVSADPEAISRVNDVMVCGSQVWLASSGLDREVFTALIPKVPASAHPYYGKPFAEIYAEAERFFEVDKSYYSPAEISIIDLENGLKGHAGKRDEIRLIEFIKK